MSFAAARPSPKDAPAHGSEVEVKLACPREMLASISSLHALAGAIWRPRSQRMSTTYFDTENDDLAHAGMMLRVRQTGARRIMTLKSASEEPGAFARRESEVVLPDERPNVELFGPEVEARITAVLNGRELVPRFETRVRRRIGELQIGETLIEIAIDDGEIVAGADRLPITEIELELKGGDPSAVFTLAAQLTGSGLLLNPAQKSERGYRLVRRETPAETRAAPIMLCAGSSFEDVMIAVIENGITQFIGNWPALLEASRPESIHQMRVALRRLRAALGQFEKIFPGAGFRPYRDVAKRLSNELGPARDHDVLIALINEGPRAALPAEVTFDRLLGIIAERRDADYRRAKDALREPETSRFILELQAFVAARGWRNRLSADRLPDLGSPAVYLATGALERLYQRARRLGKNIMRRDSEARHELRIALKNLRYCCEFFASLYDRGKVRKFIKAATALQDSLGEHNDAAVALRVIGEDASTFQGPAAGMVLGWCAREVTSPDLYVKDYWVAFKEVRSFWRN